MAKRKTDCSLDDIVREYLKKRKYEKSLKIFGFGHSKNGSNKTLGKFFDFLKKNEAEKENIKKEYDLGFEINFGCYQPEKKVSSLNLYLLA